MTSSPAPIPKNLSIDSRHAVAEPSATALSVPHSLAILFSNSLVLGPVVIQPLRSASATADTSASVISGGENEICLFSIIMFLASGIKYAKHPAFTVYIMSFKRYFSPPGQDDMSLPQRPLSA